VPFALVIALVATAPVRAEEGVPPLPDLYESIRPSVVRVIVRGGAGSGFVVGDELVATAWHVVDGGREMVVETSAGQLVPVEVRAFDRDNDVALLVPLETLEGAPPLEFSDDELRVGDSILAIGHPLLFGQGPEGRRQGLLAWSLTEGIVSSVSEGFVQTTTSLQPGNSGCPVLDRRGRVVGVAIERRGDFGTLTRISAVSELLALEEPDAPRIPVRPSLGLYVRVAGLPAGPEQRRTYGGLGGDIQVVLLNRLAVSVRAHYDWLVSGAERAAGRPGRLRELLFQAGPSIPTPFDPREPMYAEIQPYGFGGVLSVGDGEVYETLELVEPNCDPASEACAYVAGEDATWVNTLHPVFGAGVRMTLSAFMLGFEVAVAPDAPGRTFHLTGYVGLRLGKP